MMECYRMNCHLTALWQIGLDIKLKWALEAQPPLKFWTNIVCCGMCADEVPLDFLKDIFYPALFDITDGHPDEIRAELRLDDISDGYWRDPSKDPANRVPIP